MFDFDIGKIISSAVGIRPTLLDLGRMSNIEFGGTKLFCSWPEHRDGETRCEGQVQCSLRASSEVPDFLR